MRRAHGWYRITIKGIGNKTQKIENFKLNGTGDVLTAVFTVPNISIKDEEVTSGELQTNSTDNTDSTGSTGNTGNSSSAGNSSSVGSAGSVGISNKQNNS